MSILKARHRRKLRLATLRLLAAGAGLLVLVAGVAILTPMLIPNAWVEEWAEQRIAAATGWQIDLNQVRLHIAPNLKVTAANLTASAPACPDGADPQGCPQGPPPEIAGKGGLLDLSLAGWYHGQPIQRLELERAAVDLANLFALPALCERLAAARVERIQIQTVEKARLPAATAMAVIPLPAGRCQLKLSDGGSSLNLQTSPIKDVAAIEINAGEWQLIGKAPLKVDAIAASGTLEPDQIQLDQLALKLGEGSINGQLEIARGGEWPMRANLQLDRLAAADWLAYLGAPLASGSISGEMRIGSQPEASQLEGDGDALAGSLEIFDGALLGIDLLTPMETLAAGEFSDRETPFDHLKGSLSGTTGDWRFQLYALGSPQLHASGELKHAPTGLLAGELWVKHDSETRVKASVLISGPLETPRTQLAPEALKAAETGRTLLGIDGGATGVRASQALGRLKEWWRENNPPEPDDNETPREPEPEEPAGEGPWILDYEG
jgi:hypothetical protein